MMGVPSISSLVNSTMMWLHCNSSFVDAGVGGYQNVPDLVAESVWLQ